MAPTRFLVVPGPGKPRCGFLSDNTRRSTSSMGTSLAARSVSGEMLDHRHKKGGRGAGSVGCSPLNCRHRGATDAASTAS